MSDILHKINYWWENAVRRRKLSLHNTRNNAVIWYTHISPLNMFLSLVALIALIFIILLTIVGYTPILETLPGYKSEGVRLRASVIENIAKLDSLEQVIDDILIYNNNISLIIDGKSPVEKSAVSPDGELMQKELIAPNTFDSILRREVESGSRFGASERTLKQRLNMVAPIEGLISRPFAPSKEQFGVELSSSHDEKVLSADGGIVLTCHLTANKGFLVEIIHHNSNMISLYSNISEVLVKRGERVNAGEVIGYVRGEGKKQIGYELWVDGVAVDPERYIIF